VEWHRNRLRMIRNFTRDFCERKAEGVEWTDDTRKILSTSLTEHVLNVDLLRNIDQWNRFVVVS
jgi:hypothetical protein